MTRPRSTRSIRQFGALSKLPELLPDAQGSRCDFALAFRLPCAALLLLIDKHDARSLKRFRDETARRDGFCRGICGGRTPADTSSQEHMMATDGSPGVRRERSPPRAVLARSMRARNRAGRRCHHHARIFSRDSEREFDFIVSQPSCRHRSDRFGHRRYRRTHQRLERRELRGALGSRRAMAGAELPATTPSPCPLPHFVGAREK
jgi:hypothetical protein